MEITTIIINSKIIHQFLNIRSTLDIISIIMIKTCATKFKSISQIKGHRYYFSHILKKIITHQLPKIIYHI